MAHVRLSGLVLAFIAVLASQESARAQPKTVAELRLADDDRLGRTRWLGFSPDGKWMAACYEVSDRKARVRVWACKDWTAADAEFATRSTGSLRGSCAFDPTEPVLYAAGDGTRYAFPLPPKAAPAVLPLPDVPKKSNPMYSLGLGAGGKALRVVAVDRDRDTVRVDEGPADERGAPIKLFEQRVGDVRATPDVSPDGKLVVVGIVFEVAKGKQSHAVDVWSVGTGKKVARFAELDDWVAVTRFSPDGRSLAVGAMDGSLTLYDVSTGKVTRTMTEDWTVSAVDFHPTRPFVAYGTFDRKGQPNLRVVDLPSGRVLASQAADPFGVHHVRFSPDGKWVATLGGEGVVRVWELEKLIVK